MPNPACNALYLFSRLLLELKLPPPDAYHKLRHTIEEVNTQIATYYGDDDKWQVGWLRFTVSVARASPCRLMFGKLLVKRTAAGTACLSCGTAHMLLITHPAQPLNLCRWTPRTAMWPLWFRLICPCTERCCLPQTRVAGGPHARQRGVCRPALRLELHARVVCHAVLRGTSLHCSQTGRRLHLTSLHWVQPLQHPCTPQCLLLRTALQVQGVAMHPRKFAKRCSAIWFS